MVAGLGFEPRLSGSEPLVLPLDDPAFRKAQCKYWYNGILTHYFTCFNGIIFQL